MTRKACSVTNMSVIPFTYSSTDKLKKRARTFISAIHYKKNSNLNSYLENSDIDLNREEYLGICISSLIYNFLFFLILSGIIFYYLKLDFIKFSLITSALFSFFIFYTQISYPRVNAVRRQRNIERNLIPALQDMVVQLNSGIPIYNILINISYSDYGELSIEFKKIVKMINTGMPQMEVIEKIADRNSSIFFRRTLWQISNGLRAGSDISIIVSESIKSLNEEQLIQIQNYGSKLNPIIMFYMLMTVILPALAITFLTILTSMINLPRTASTFVFAGLLIVVGFFQIMFLGVIKSIRPTLI